MRGFARRRCIGTCARWCAARGRFNRWQEWNVSSLWNDERACILQIRLRDWLSSCQGSDERSHEYADDLHGGGRCEMSKDLLDGQIS